MVMIADGREAARQRAAVERLHEAQLVALAAGAGSPAASVGNRDAYAAGRELLENLGEIGSLLVGLSRPNAGSADDAAARRRVVALAAACANALAEVVSLAFEVEEAAADHAEAGPHRSAPAAAAGAGGSKGTAPLGARTSLRAVTDMHILLVEQLKRLMQHAERRESWRRVPPGELWRGLLHQVAGLLPLAAALEAGGLGEADAKELGRLAADSANYLAFLRFYPRLPTA